MDPELVHERGGLVGLELAQLHLDPGGQRIDERIPMDVALGDPGHDLGFPGDVALADVEQDEDRLLAQEPEATQDLLLVAVEVEVADGRAG